jgi:hypothetical protein
LAHPKAPFASIYTRERRHVFNNNKKLINLLMLKGLYKKWCKVRG